MNPSVRYCLFTILALALSSGAAGQLHPGFGQGGRVSLSALPFDRLVDVVVLPGDSIAALGWSGSVDSSGFNAVLVVMKFTDAGEPVLSFGSGGRVQLDFEGMEYSTARALEVLPGGNLLVMGAGHRFADPAYSPLCFLRLKPDGRVDSTFGNQGTAEVSFYSGQEFPGEMKTDVTGRLCIGGGSWDTLGAHNVPVVGRYTGAMTPDSSFGGSGRLVLDFTAGLQPLKTDRHLTGGEVLDLLPMPDGSLICGGTYGPYAFLTKLTALGSLDSSFASAGHFIFSVDDPLYNHRVQRLALLPDGTFAAAVSWDAPWGLNFYLMRFTSDGAALSSASIDFGGNEEELMDVAVNADGALALAGHSTTTAHWGQPGWQSDYFAIAVLPDFMDWSQRHLHLISFENERQGGAAAVDFFSDGSLLLGGFTFTAAAGESDFALMRVQATATAIAGQETQVLKLEVQPNPARDPVVLNWDGGARLLILQDAMGRLIESRWCVPGDTWSLAGLPAGLYLFSVADLATPPVKLIVY